MLELNNISIDLNVQNGNGKTRILNNLSFKFEQGKFYCITGPNGGGKTSIAKVIMGIYKPTEGRIFFENEDITEKGITERARLGICYAFQIPPRFKGLRVKDLLKISAAKENMGLRNSLKSVGLCPEEYMDREVDESFSGGEMKRIEIATMLLRNPKVIIYDEPEAGVDLWSFHKLVNVIKEKHEREKTATIVITHQERILALADEIILVSEGQIKRTGTPEAILPGIKKDIECELSGICGGDDYAECCR